MINQLGLKIEPLVTCVLFFLPSKSALKKSLPVFRCRWSFTIDYAAGVRTVILVFAWFTVVVLNASYEIKSCLLLNNLTFSCCLHVFLNNFLVPRVDVNRALPKGQWYNDTMVHGTMIFDGSPFSLMTKK